MSTIHPLLARLGLTKEPARPRPPVGPANEVTLELSWFDPRLAWMLHLWYDGTHVGKLGYAACTECGRGSIGKISVYTPLTRRGLGRQLIQELREVHPGLTWYTTAQTVEGLDFWRAMARESRQPYKPDDRRCPHLLPAETPMDGRTIPLR